MQLDYGFVEEIAAIEGGKAIKNCIQCGTCTSSCPVRAEDSNFNPRKIIAKALLGLKEEVLSSDEIWYCARCQYCVANCKKDICPGDVITAIRTIAIREGHKETEGARHTLAFLKDMKATGKLNEALLPLRTLRLNTIKMIPYAIRMLKAGKIPTPFVNTIDGLDEVRELIEEFKD